MTTIHAGKGRLKTGPLNSVRAHQQSIHLMAWVIARRTIALVLALMTLVACTTVDRPTGDTQAYRSIWSELFPKTLRRELGQDSLQGAFYFAAAAKSQAAAQERWTKFLSDWAPAHGGFEDAMHARFVTWAELEMQRLQYLKAGDLSEAIAVSGELRGLAAELEQ